VQVRLLSSLVCRKPVAEMGPGAGCVRTDVNLHNPGDGTVTIGVVVYVVSPAVVSTGRRAWPCVLRGTVFVQLEQEGTSLPLDIFSVILTCLAGPVLGTQPLPLQEL
jgi:hypothetical protein